MSSLSRVPSPRLAPFVHSFWYHEAEPFLHVRERVLPVGFMQLLVNLDEDALEWWAGAGLDAHHAIRGAGIGGLRRHAVALDPRGQRRIVGVRFVPGGAVPLLGMPATELADTHVDLGDLWGDAWRVLRERLLEASSPTEVLSRLETALLERLADRAPDGPTRFAADALARGVALGDLESHMNMSARRFRDRFAAQVGCAPKQFARIERLQRAVAARIEGASWTDVALASGYYDQAHLVREFRQLAGLRPSNYLPRSDGRNHVPISDRGASVSSKTRAEGRARIEA